MISATFSVEARNSGTYPSTRSFPMMASISTWLRIWAEVRRQLSSNIARTMVLGDHDPLGSFRTVLRGGRELPPKRFDKPEPRQIVWIRFDVEKGLDQICRAASDVQPADRRCAL